MSHSVSNTIRIHGQSTEEQWESMLDQDLTYIGTGMEPEGHGRGHGNGGKQTGESLGIATLFRANRLGR